MIWEKNQHKQITQDCYVTTDQKWHFSLAWSTKSTGVMAAVNKARGTGFCLQLSKPVLDHLSLPRSDYKEECVSFIYANSSMLPSLLCTAASLLESLQS